MNKQIISCVCWFLLTAVTGQAAELVIYPTQIKLTGPAAKQSVILEQLNNNEPVGQVTKDVQWTTSDQKIAIIKDGIVLPISNGTTTLTAKHGKQTATATITVEQFTTPYQVNFRHEVQAVLSKSGCNMGACHGALLGKNGFRLSLRGYDSEYDFQALTRQAQGRRVNPTDPARSLLLTKPTGAIPHKGGVRFDVDSPEYKTIVDWIAQGAPPPTDKDSSLVKLEMLPNRALLQPKQDQQLLVLAHYSDGHVADVTRWAKFTSNVESVVTVDQQGIAKVTGSGQAAVSAWFASQLVVTPITVPYQQQIAPDVFTQSPRANLIDELVIKQLQRLNLPPSPMASDSEFLRRVFIDTIGTLPTVAEAEKFLADTSPSKREQLVDQLLSRPEFVDYWTYKWSDLLLVNSEKLKPNAMWAYSRWIRSQVEQNTPWDEFVRQILTASGSTLDNGATNYFVLHLDATELSENTSQAFLGMSINCAKCHNHPLEKWTNDQYYGMANLFSRVRIKEALPDGNAIIFTATEGDLIQPRTGKPQAPAPLDAKPLEITATTDRRIEFANWLTSPSNPYFARAIVNRVWANYMTVGLVDAVDDLRLTNPASNEELLNSLAKYMIEQKYDLKKLMRLILLSTTYQRSSATLPENAVDKRYYSRYYPKRMMAEVLLDAISQVSEVPTEFDRESGDRRNRNLKGRGERYPTLRAIQLPDSNVYSYFLKSFGRAQRLLTCECERTDEPSMVQVLHLSNGDTINDKLAQTGSVVGRVLGAKLSPEEIVEQAYLATLTRKPTVEESAALVKIWHATPATEQRQLIEDLYWSLMSGKEFLLNH
jgi:hypothetical protein